MHREQSPELEENLPPKVRQKDSLRKKALSHLLSGAPRNPLSFLLSTSVLPVSCPPRYDDRKRLVEDALIPATEPESAELKN